MLNSVSGVNFKGNPIIDREGKYTTQPQQPTKTAEMPADSFGKPKKKHTGLKAFLITAGALLVAAAGLGWAAKTGKISEIKTPNGFLDNTTNFFTNIGKKIAKAYDDVIEWGATKFGKKENIIEEVVENIPEA